MDWLFAILVAVACHSAECGACGAVVHEWHYDIGFDGRPVEICDECWEVAHG